jgi:tripartite-type tricarboxylate transporter receptor subunit TctC
LLGTLSLALAGLVQPALAQSNKPVSLIVPYPAGGGSDFIARTLAPVMSKVLGRTIVIENLSGAGGAIGSQRVLQREADGDTLLLGSPNEVILAPEVNKALKYKAEDFRLIGPATVSSQVLVARTNMPAANIRQLLEQASAPNAKPISYGSVGVGSLYHVTGAVLASQTHSAMFHVPYRGAAPLVQDLMGGQVDISFLPLAGNVLELIRDKKLKAYGIAQNERNPLAPEIPTLGEIAPQLQNFNYPTWAGLLVKAETPDAKVKLLQDAFKQALNDPQVKTAIESTGSAVGRPMTTEQANQAYRKETALFRKIVADQAISVN